MSKRNDEVKQKKLEEQQQNLTDLMELIQENPNLPIVPMVNSDILGDFDYMYYMGSWGQARVDEILLKGDRVYFRSIDEDEVREQIYFEIEDELESILSGQDYDEGRKEELIDMEIEKCLEEDMEWEKAIVVKIELP